MPVRSTVLAQRAPDTVPDDVRKQIVAEFEEKDARITELEEQLVNAQARVAELEQAAASPPEPDKEDEETGAE